MWAGSRYVRVRCSDQPSRPDSSTGHQYRAFHSGWAEIVHGFKTRLPPFFFFIFHSLSSSLISLCSFWVIPGVLWAAFRRPKKVVEQALMLIIWCLSRHSFWFIFSTFTVQYFTRFILIEFSSLGWFFLRWANHLRWASCRSFPREGCRAGESNPGLQLSHAAP